MTTPTGGTISCFSTGAVRTKRRDRGIRRYLPGGWRADTLPVNVFALEHSAGLCLFDAGQTADATRSGHFPWWWPYFRLARFELHADEEAGAQLARRGLAGAVRWIVVSHLHTDHVGGLAGVRAQEVLVARVEWERAVGVPGRLRGYLPQHWPPAVSPRLVDFVDGPVGPFPASCDLAGDGRLLLVPTPGHTPGHMSLLAEAGGRRYLLGGDLCHAAGELGHTAPAVDAFCRREGVIPLMTHDATACALANGDGDADPGGYRPALDAGSVPLRKVG